MAPLHPALVHLPIGLAFVAPLVAAGLALALRRGALPRRAWWLAAALQASVVAGGGAAFVAGEREEHRVEAIVPEAAIEAHEERAEVFLWAAGGAAVVSAAALAVPAAAAAPVAALAAAGALATAGLAAWTGRAGGELVYVHGAAAAYTGAAAQAAGPAGRPHDDD